MATMVAVGTQPGSANRSRSRRRARRHHDRGREIRPDGAGRRHPTRHDLRGARQRERLRHQVVQLVGEIVRVLPPAVGILLEAPHDDRRECRAHLRAQLRHRHRSLGDLRREDLLRRTTRERRLPGEHLVRDASEGVDVGAVVDRRVGRGLLRRHVGRRTQQPSLTRARARRRAAPRRCGTRAVPSRCRSR